MEVSHEQAAELNKSMLTHEETEYNSLTRSTTIFMQIKGVDKIIILKWILEK
jgi:hypothetical protein